MQTDVNKGLSFEYNHLDLVQSAFEGTEEVKFIWDATGRKLAKEVGGVTTYYFNGIEYTGPQFTHLATAEGAARNIDGLMNDGVWVYDYYLKDHLGNVRAVVTNENSLLLEEKVTMELAKRMLEDSNFDNVSATDQDKPYLYPYDPDDATNQKVSELSSYTGKIIGPAKVMSIAAGEKIDLSTKYWYTEAPGDPLTNVTEIPAGTLLNLGLASTGVIPSTAESGMALINNVSGSQFGALNSFIDDSFDNIDLSKPQAFIVYMTFDKEMNLDPINSGVIQVGEANSLGQLSQNAIAPKKDGYFYAYVTNRSSGKVNFDNMVIKRWKPNVRVTYDYYPYGLTWEDPKLPSDPEGIHDHCYQDKEFQWAEFTTGHGLALHDFHARMYDGATGRWLVPDPAAQFANPYLAMGNNPVVGVDPDGRFSVALSWCTGFVHGFFSKGNGRLSEAWNNANRSSSNNLKIKRGLFVTDNNKTFGGRVWELISRFTWQLPQTIGGYYTAQTYNLFQKVNWVEHEHGATVVNADGFGASTDDDGEWGGVTQGSFIVGDPTIVANANNPLFQHEYGHYLQSQEMGWGYYNRVGIPSIFSKENRHTYHPVEQDANRRAFMYFNREVDGFYTSSEEFADLGRTEGWDFQENPLGLNINGVRRSEYWDFENESRMSLLNEFSSVRAKWYDYLFWKPQIGLLNAFFYNKKL